MDAQYTVLARRFRPQTFTEVVGQERISQTLRNAMLEGRVAHAYLFTGARGVGKTSMARIFAKALNCPNAVDGVPCNQCEQCLGIAAGNDVDVSEIDGASNRGIDDIRSLRANVSVKSMRSKHKVYIIDEVHMLTKEAFNALLKTLEEPPPMVKFIFCTTEPEKVPITILSRCQRFDFGTISLGGISKRLQQLAEAEGFQVEPGAIALVARRAAGSMRDSQSLFDQLLAFGSEKITEADVHRLLGTAPDDRLIDLVEALIARDRSLALAKLDSAVNEGVQLEAFTDQLVGYFRDLMVTACGAHDAPLLSVGVDQRDALKRQADRWGLQTIVAAMQILAEAKGRMQRVTYGRALAELALVRISLLQDLDQLEGLIGALKSGQPITIPVSTGQPSATLLKPSGVQSAALQVGLEKKNELVKSDDAQASDSSSKPSNEGESSSSELRATTGNSIQPAASQPELSHSPVELLRSNDTHSAGESSSADLIAEPVLEASFSENDENRMWIPPEALEESGNGVVDSEPLSPARIEWKPGCEKELHAAVIDRLADMTGTYLSRVATTAISGPNVLEFWFPANYDLGRQACDRPEVTSRIERVVAELVGTAVRVVFKTQAAPVGGPLPPKGPSPSKPAASSASTAANRGRLVEEPGDPFVRDVMELFGVKAWRVQPLASEGVRDEGRVEPQEE